MSLATYHPAAAISLHQEQHQRQHQQQHIRPQSSASSAPIFVIILNIIIVIIVIPDIGGMCSARKCSNRREEAVVKESGIHDVSIDNIEAL